MDCAIFIDLQFIYHDVIYYPKLPNNETIIIGIFFGWCVWFWFEANSH